MEKIESDIKSDTLNNELTDKNGCSEYIKVSVIDVQKTSRFNAVKLYELYIDQKDSIEYIMNHPNEISKNEVYDKIIETYKVAESYRVSDPELHDALILTCCFQYYMEVSRDDDLTQFMDEQEPDEKGKKKPSKLKFNKFADYLIKKYCIISHNSIPYLYIGSQYYSDAKRDRLKKDITKILQLIGYSDHAKISDIIKDIIDRIINKTHKLHEYPFNVLSSEFIPVENGIVHRKSVQLLPNSPAFRMIYHLNAKYNPNVDNKQINDYLNSLVENKEDADLLLQIPAQALLQNNHQLAYIFTGEGNNGKSAFITFLSKFIGSENYTSASLQELTENRFQKAELEGKLLNMYPDLNKSAIKYSGIFKSLTGGDEINCERKFGAPFKLKNKAVLVFSANELPDVSDATYAFWRRWCVIPFPNKFEPNPNFVDTITTNDNMSAFLNLVIHKMNRIETQGLTKSDRIEQACHLWKTSSSSAYAFVSDCIQKDVNGKIWRPVLEDLYIAFCEEKDVTRQDFVNVAKELAKIGATTARARKDNKLIYVYAGIKYTKENSEVKYIPYVEDDAEAPELNFKEEPKSI